MWRKVVGVEKSICKGHKQGKQSMLKITSVPSIGRKVAISLVKNRFVDFTSKE